MKSTKTSLQNNIQKGVLDVLIGTILGDASMIINRRATKAYYSFEQCWAHIEYAQIVLDGLGPYTEDRILKHLDKKENKSVKFTTLSNTDFAPIYRMFYDLNWRTGTFTKVKVPTDIATYLTPKALAHWVMDDGSLPAKGGLILCTERYGYESILLLKAALENNFNLRCTVQGIKTGKFRIYIRVVSMPLLISTIKAHVHPTIFTKLHGKKINRFLDC